MASIIGDFAMSEMTTRLLSMKEVQRLTSLSRTHIGRLESEGKFPLRVRLTRHPRGRFGYEEGKVYDWLHERISAGS